MPGIFNKDAFWIALVLGYFAVHVLYRTLMGGALGLDEAQIVLESQRLAWGYGPQPPLYAWLQWAVSGVFGNTIFALALLKNLLLAGSYLVVFHLLRRDHDALTAGLGALSLLLLPQIAWESQRALTHSVLVTCLALATIAVFWRALAAERQTGLFVLFGILVGLGAIAKHNYLFVPLVLLLAALSLPDMRRRLAHPALALGLLLGALLPAKSYLWIAAHKQHSLVSLQKLGIDRADQLPPLLSGGLSLITAIAGFAAILLVVVALLHRFHRQSPATATDVAATPLFRLMQRYLLISLVFLAIVVAFSGTTNVKDRWLQPQFAILAPLAVLWLLQRLDAGGRRRLAQTYALIALAVAIALPVHLLAGKGLVSAPFAAMAERLENSFSGQPPVIWASNNWLAGNLKFVRPGWSVNDSRWLDAGAPSETAMLALARPAPNEAMAGQLQAAGIDAARADLPARQDIAEPYRFPSTATFTLTMIPIRENSPLTSTSTTRKPQ